MLLRNRIRMILAFFMVGLECFHPNVLAAGE